MGRIRAIIPTIDSSKAIALYHLFFVNSDEEEVIVDGKECENIHAPLKIKDLVKEFTQCKEGQNYLLVYVDDIVEGIEKPSFVHVQIK